MSLCYTIRCVTVVGLLLGGTFGAVSIILPFTAGGFIYIATVGVIPELLANEKATPAQVTLDKLSLSQLFFRTSKKSLPCFLVSA